MRFYSSRGKPRQSTLTLETTLADPKWRRGVKEPGLRAYLLRFGSLAAHSKQNSKRERLGFPHRQVLKVLYAASLASRRSLRARSFSRRASSAMRLSSLARFSVKANSITLNYTLKTTGMCKCTYSPGRREVIGLEQRGNPDPLLSDAPSGAAS